MNKTGIDPAPTSWSSQMASEQIPSQRVHTGARKECKGQSPDGRLFKRANGIHCKVSGRWQEGGTDL